jgi:hypothetical protein
MKFARILAIILLTFSLQGCVSIGLAVATATAGVGMGAGLEHTVNGIVFKTFSASANDVRFATLKTLDYMGMPVTADEQTDTGWRMSATAFDRTIDIEFERLTPYATRMRVVANEGWIFFKDSATATEIILQTAQTLEDSAPANASSGLGQRRRTSL